VYNQGKLLTQAVCASVRHHPHYPTAAETRAHKVVPKVVFLQMVSHPLIDIGIIPFARSLELVLNDE
jgi:hypothetical protein